MPRKQKDNKVQPAKTPRVPSVPIPSNAPDAQEVRRLHVYFAGSVQGVGFRYTAQTVSRGFKVTGWVRNCSDGRVELTAEGTVEQLEAYLRSLGDEMSGYIGKVERTWENATGEWTDFAVSPTL